MESLHQVFVCVSILLYIRKNALENRAILAACVNKDHWSRKVAICFGVIQKASYNRNKELSVFQL